MARNRLNVTSYVRSDSSKPWENAVAAVGCKVVRLEMAVM